MASSLDFELEIGVPFIRTVTWRSDGVLVNTTGYTAKMHVREYLESPDILLTVSSALGHVTAGGANGVFTINVPGSATAALQPMVGVYDFFVTSALGNDPIKLLWGNIKIGRSVTRPAT